MEDNQSAQYSLWGADNVVYGPVELPTLISWVKDERVTVDTWIFDAQNDRWRKAPNLPELQLFFKKRAAARADAGLSGTGVLKPGMLRRVKVLADLTDEQLERFAQFMEAQPVRQWTQIVKQ